MRKWRTSRCTCAGDVDNGLVEWYNEGRKKTEINLGMVIKFQNTDIWSCSVKLKIRKTLIKFIKRFFLTHRKCNFVRSPSHINLTFLNAGTLQPDIGNRNFIQFMRLGAKWFLNCSTGKIKKDYHTLKLLKMVGSMNTRTHNRLWTQTL